MGVWQKILQRKSKISCIVYWRVEKMKITFKGLDPKCKFAPVDIMHSCTEEFRCDPISIWWLHKSNGPGVGFEVVTDPTDRGRMLWVSGPEPASTHDLTFLRGGKENSETIGKGRHSISMFRRR